MGFLGFLVLVLLSLGGCAASGTQLSSPATDEAPVSQATESQLSSSAVADADSVRDPDASEQEVAPTSIEPEEEEIAPAKREAERRLPVVADRVRRFVDWVKDRNPVPIGDR